MKNLFEYLSNILELYSDILEYKNQLTLAYNNKRFFIKTHNDLLVQGEKKILQSGLSQEDIFKILENIHTYNDSFIDTDQEKEIVKILNFLVAIGCNILSQSVLEEVLQTINTKDYKKYFFDYPVSLSAEYFLSSPEAYQNFLYFYNTLLSGNKYQPIDIHKIEEYKNDKNYDYRTQDFQEFVKNSLLDSLGQFKYQLLDTQFQK